MRDINLKAMEYFEAVARLGTVTLAAAELAVSPSAVSQQIRALEAQFGVKLFRREKRRLTLTVDGDRLFQTATQAFGALRNATAAISRQRHMRALTLRVSPSFGVRWLGSRIADFAEANPDWNIRVDATPDFTAFDTEPVDFDLRYGHGDWPDLSVEPVMNDLVLPLVSPTYLARLQERAETPAALLAEARLIDSVKSHCRWDVWLAAQRIEMAEVSYPFRFDRSSMSIEMAKRGGGVALDNALLCLDDLKSGDLVPLAPTLPALDLPAYWLTCPHRHKSRRIVKRFSDWVRRAAQSHEVETRAHLSQLGVSTQRLSKPT